MYVLFAALLKLVVVDGVNLTVIVAEPAALPVIVIVVAAPDCVAVTDFEVGLTVAFPVADELTASVPAIDAAHPDFTVAVNVFVFPLTTEPDDADKVIVGVLLAIEHDNVLVLVLPLNKYPAFAVIVTV